jgi:hypothetical protein
LHRMWRDRCVKDALPRHPAGEERKDQRKRGAAQHAGAADSLIAFGSSLAADAPPVRQHEYQSSGIEEVQNEQTRRVDDGGESRDDGGQ